MLVTGGLFEGDDGLLWLRSRKRYSRTGLSCMMLGFARRSGRCKSWVKNEGGQTDIKG